MFPESHRMLLKSHRMFPESHQMFPKLHQMFPKSHRMFPKSRRMFPKSHRMFLKSHRMFPESHQMFPKSHQMFPKSHRMFPKSRRMFPKSGAWSGHPQPRSVLADLHQVRQVAGGKHHVCALVHEGCQVSTVLIVPWMLSKIKQNNGRIRMFFPRGWSADRNATHSPPYGRGSSLNAL
jgi:hypothetical protein